MNRTTRPTAARARRDGRATRRRGVVSVVAMMFLILFGSLAAAMAIMSRSNILTAATHQHVTRALGAAETGLSIAESRLQEAAGRFVIEKSDVDAGFGLRLWTGGFASGDGIVNVLPPTSYVDPGDTPSGLAEAIAQIHKLDKNTVEVAGITEPTIGPAPTGTDETVYETDNWLRTPAVALTQQGSGGATNAAFQIDYAPLASGNEVRIIVTGYDFDYSADGYPVTRRIVQDFKFVKRVDAAVVSPSRIMIGKNVMVEGDLGAVYSDVQYEDGDPLVLKSDFWGLDSALDTKLTALFNALPTYDVDHDNRLRVGHPVERLGIPDGDGDGQPDGASADVTGDGYFDEFDLFISFFDKDKDGKVVLSGAMTSGTPADGLSPEFAASDGKSIDDDLAYLIDACAPDRNRNGVASFTDSNGNGRYDPGSEPLSDYELVSESSLPEDLKPYVTTAFGDSRVFKDQVLGFRDGVIDKRDQYAKVRGRLVFRVKESDWVAKQGAYMARLRGPIKPDEGQSAMRFQASEAELPAITADSFTGSQTALTGAADGDGKSFVEQVADNLGVSASEVAAWDPVTDNPTDPSKPRYFPLNPDANHDGMPDNWATAYFEKMPFNSPSFADYYYRPVYENMTFRNIQIPAGNNGLFRNCAFIGVTYARTSKENAHSNWSLYGKMKLDSSGGRPTLDPPRFIYGDGAGETSFPTMLDSSDRPVLMATTPMDKADIPADQVASTVGYSTLPNPLIIDGKRCVNTKDFSNNIRFHDCLFVGSLVSDPPKTFTHIRNKLQFTGSTRFTETNPDHPDEEAMNPDPEDAKEIAKSSLMAPNYSVDIGCFNSPNTQDVRLRGAIVAGVLDVRGNAEINGALLLTFKPQLGVAPLADAIGAAAGNPALFNATIGYFGPADGDQESLDPATLPIVGGVKIVGWDLDGDGLADLGPDQTPTSEQFAAGAAAVPFHGYGHVNLRFDPNMTMPDGILLPLQVDVQRSTYAETSR